MKTNLIKELRKHKGLTQEELAKKLNIATSTYGGYEQGTSEPSIDMIIKMANFFDVSLDYLCGRQWNNNVGYMPDNTKEIVKKILQLNSLELKCVDAYITALLDIKH